MSSSDPHTRWEVAGRAAQALEDVSDGLIVLDQDWTIVFANGNAGRFVSKPVAELVGQNFWTVFPEAYDHEFGILYREAMASQERHELEAYYGPLQGWFDVRIIPTPAGLTLSFTQVNERRKAAEAQQALVIRLEGALARQGQTQAVVVALAEAMSVADVAATVEQLATGTLGTSFAGLAVLDESGTELRFVAVDHEPSIPVDGLGPIAESVRHRRARFLGSLAETIERYPAAGDGPVDRAPAVASLPLVARGRSLGVLVLRWIDERSFSEADRALLRMLASQAALAVDRTTLIARQRDVAETLQRAMLPDELPIVDGAEISACYLPATTDLSVGGDWYDVFSVPGGRIVFVVGDVCGHGVEAAAVMGQVRNALRAYMIAADTPASALAKLDEVVSRSGSGLFATVVAGTYDPASGELVWANAGHPPLVVHTSAGPRYLPMSRGVPVGVEHRAPRADERVVLSIGDAVIGYTDGLIERRGEHLDAGMARLAGAIVKSANKIGAATWCAELVYGVLGADAHRDDDICVLALQRVAATGDSELTR